MEVSDVADSIVNPLGSVLEPDELSFPQHLLIKPDEPAIVKVVLPKNYINGFRIDEIWTNACQMVEKNIVEISRHEKEGN
ncbi:hypothetical protein VNO78_12347 [Psophocarpus tetragonolobus]|uniref:Uncharacterized protein n=1 Tax=Psophocarpus tetragonolobus TaxID=3891 RepID=A0AAN9XPG3_PSOTE